MSAAEKFARIPAELRALPQWVVWRFYNDGKRPKPTKVPYSPSNGHKAKSNDPSTWAAFEKASERLDQGKADGLGFMFANGYAGVDLDGCRNPETGELTPEAQRIVDTLSSYTELSPSGRGVHVIAKCSKALPGRRRGCIELYVSCRFFTMTGDVLRGVDIIPDRTAELEAIHATLKDPKQASASARPIQTLTSNFSDEDLLDRARRMKIGDKFSALFDRGDLSGYAKESGEGDWSAADLALMNHLAFLTDRDKGRMRSLFLQSALGKRDKAHREDYLERTIDKAIEDCREVYDPQRAAHQKVEEHHGLGAREDLLGQLNALPCFVRAGITWEAFRRNNDEIWGKCNRGEVYWPSDADLWAFNRSRPVISRSLQKPITILKDKKQGESWDAAASLIIDLASLDSVCLVPAPLRNLLPDLFDMTGRQIAVTKQEGYRLLAALSGWTRGAVIRSIEGSTSRTPPVVHVYEGAAFVHPVKLAQFGSTPDAFHTRFPSVEDILRDLERLKFVRLTNRRRQWNKQEAKANVLYRGPVDLLELTDEERERIAAGKAVDQGDDNGSAEDAA